MFVNIIREMINFEPGKVIDGVVFSCETSHQTSLTLESLRLRGRALELGNPKVWGSIPHGESEFFLCFTLVTRRKNVPRYIIVTLPDKISRYTSPEQRLWSSSTLSPFKCCWLPMFLCHLAEPTRRWFAPRNSSRSAFFSAILYDLRSLHPGTCLNTKTPCTFRLKRAFPTRISKSASFWLCSWQANWTRPRKRLGYDFNFLSTASGTVNLSTILTPSSETPRLNLWSWSTNKTARWN